MEINKRTVSLGLMTFMLMLVGFISSALAEDWVSNANISIGLKKLSSDWSPTEDQFALGGSLDVRPPNWPVALVARVSKIELKKEQLFGLNSKGVSDEFDFGLLYEIKVLKSSRWLFIVTRSWTRAT